MRRQLRPNTSRFLVFVVMLVSALVWVAYEVALIALHRENRIRAGRGIALVLSVFVFLACGIYWAVGPVA